MLAHLMTANRLSLLENQLRLAETVTPHLMSCVIDGACVRWAAIRRTDQAAQLSRLIATGAWTDAALALIDFELPQWRLRRLAQDEGEWLCSLSKQPNLPLELDDTADARHENLPLALLGAFLEAQRQTADAHEPRLSAVPQIGPATARAICCDNFS